MPAYSYRPLSRCTSIRILQLLPNNKETDRVECCLADYSLSGTQKSHQYEALSYVQGNPNDTQSILVNSHDFQVTQSLYTALLHIRDDQLVRRLWVDAICIYQNDDDEKASQIPLMRDVYTAMLTESLSGLAMSQVIAMKPLRLFASPENRLFTETHLCNKARQCRSLIKQHVQNCYGAIGFDAFG